MKLPSGIIIFFRSNSKGTKVILENKELILCKDCKHCRNYCRIIEDVESKYACELKEESGYPYGQFRVHEDDYCSRAERKEE